MTPTGTESGEGARPLRGKALAASLREGTRAAVEATRKAGSTPKLAVVTATDDESSAWYVRSLVSAAEKSGLLHEVVHLGPKASTEEVRDALRGLGEDGSVHGVILQTPLPPGVDARALAEAVPAAKDVDGANPLSLGRLAAGLAAFAPATAEAVIALLDHYEVPLRGARAVVVGRSTVVGKPLAHLLLARDATVTVCHSRTRDLAEVTREADILIAARGAAGTRHGGARPPRRDRDRRRHQPDPGRRPHGRRRPGGGARRWSAQPRPRRRGAGDDGGPAGARGAGGAGDGDRGGPAGV
ncbi:LOW QUALITY PROTEIN: methylenetetrahydrofolate dehydrogenase, partial [Streptomyces sp. SPB78]